MNRRRAIAVILVAAAAPGRLLAQQQGKVRRIGYLAARSRSTPSNPDVYYDAFVQGMRELGYVEGRNLVIEWRFADGKFERLPGLAAELVRLKPEVIVTHATPAVDALKRATRAIPVVSANLGDPLGLGFAASLARPGGNITGLSAMQVDVSPKYLELLKLMVPALSRAAVLVNPGNPAHLAFLKGVQSAAKEVGVKILLVDARNPEEIERGFAAMHREHADAGIILGDSLFIGQRGQITELAAQNRLPAMYSFREDVKAGGLMSYGLNLVDFYRHAASYVDKILKGAKPGELPIEQPTKFHLAINRKTAKALGITIPKDLLLRADEVIE